VLVFLGIPLIAGILIRYSMLVVTGAKFFHEKFLPSFGPVALLSLIYTIIVMFAVQGDRIINMVGEVARVSVPMALYFCLMFFGSLIISWKADTNYSYAVTQAFTASSNNFELAIAVAVATFGIESHEALAATVGPLIEVPALLALVYVALWIKKRWYDNRDAYLRSVGKFPTGLREFVAPK
jgi:ACR3 family arsenite transporter